MRKRIINLLFIAVISSAGSVLAMDEGTLGPIGDFFAKFDATCSLCGYDLEKDRLLFDTIVLPRTNAGVLIFLSGVFGSLSEVFGFGDYCYLCDDCYEENLQYDKESRAEDLDSICNDLKAEVARVDKKRKDAAAVIGRTRAYKFFKHRILCLK